EVLFAQLTAFGEAAVGLGLLFGCLTTLASAIGLVLVANYGLAVQWQGSAQQGFHYMLIVTLLALLPARAGPPWCADGRLRAHRPSALNAMRTGLVLPSRIGNCASTLSLATSMIVTFPPASADTQARSPPGANATVRGFSPT